MRAYLSFLPFGVAMLLAFSGTSCVSAKKFDYASAEGVMFQRIDSEARQLPPVTVLPFRDRRPSKMLAENLGEEGDHGIDVESRLDRGTFAYGWIPLMPFAWISREIPENRSDPLATLRSYWCHFDRELAEAAVVSVRHSELFEDVLFAEKPENATTRLVLMGTIHSTKYEGERLTYGVTYLLAPVLWVVGFPTAVSHNTLALDFMLVDRETKSVVWKFRYEGTASLAHFLYFHPGDDGACYARLAKQAMNAALYNLDDSIRRARSN